jgi:cobalt-zinc-cadmium efflux system outer membrane protein
MASAQTVVSEANQDLAQSQSMPDVTLSAGFRRFEQGNDNALLFGVSVPFPIFDKKRDAVKAAGFRRQADMLNRVAVERDLISQQNAARAQLISAQKQLNLLETDALREARSAYDASVKGYRAGKFDLTTTLNTRKALIDAGLAVIDAARTVNIQDITLRSLTGASPFTGDIQ